jgi:hypothetical protein
MKKKKKKKKKKKVPSILFFCRNGIVELKIYSLSRRRSGYFAVQSSTKMSVEGLVVKIVLE